MGVKFSEDTMKRLRELEEEIYGYELEADDLEDFYVSGSPLPEDDK